MPKIADFDNNSTFLELAPEVIQVPTGDDVRIKDPEEYMQRLKEMTTPAELMKHFVISALNPYTFDETHEGRWTRHAGISAFIIGWIYGGMLNTRDYHDEYRRNHNASVFDSNYRAKRHHFDTLIYKVSSRGLGMGFKAALLTLSAGFASLGSISVRNDLYYPDWAIGFAGIGAISRSWLGLRGLVAGAGFGLMAGTLGYGIVRGAELVSGKTVTEFRYHEEMEYIKKRQALRDRWQRKREDWVNEKLIGD